MLNDITVAFSGHNIRLFAIIAIESFLMHYPDMKKNIIYFDDGSTDGTREELESRGIKVITWTNQRKKEFDKLIEANFFGGFVHTMVVRCAFITRDILEQINTKYAFISDGDVVFKQPNFLDPYIRGVKEGSKIVSKKSDILCTEENYKEFTRSPLASYYSKYGKSVNYRDFKYSIPRVHFLQTLINLEYFKQINLVGDFLLPEILQIMNGQALDVGTDFYHRIRENQIPAQWVDEDHISKYLTHWGWIASANRASHNSPFVRYNRDIETEMRRFLFEEGVDTIVRELGIHPMKLIKSFKKTEGQSNFQ